MLPVRAAVHPVYCCAGGTEALAVVVWLGVHGKPEQLTSIKAVSREGPVYSLTQKYELRMPIEDVGEVA